MSRRWILTWVSNPSGRLLMKDWASERITAWFTSSRVASSYCPHSCSSLLSLIYFFSYQHTNSIGGAKPFIFLLLFFNLSDGWSGSWYLTLLFVLNVMYKMWRLFVFGAGLGFVTSLAFVFLIGDFVSSWMGATVFWIGEIKK